MYRFSFSVGILIVRGTRQERCETGSAFIDRSCLSDWAILKVNRFPGKLPLCRTLRLKGLLPLALERVRLVMNIVNMIEHIEIVLDSVEFKGTIVLL